MRGDSTTAFAEEQKACPSARSQGTGNKDNKAASGVKYTNLSL